MNNGLVAARIYMCSNYYCIILTILPLTVFLALSVIEYIRNIIMNFLLLFFFFWLCVKSEGKKNNYAGKKRHHAQLR